MKHPLIKYGNALVCLENKTNKINKTHIKSTLKNQLEYFRLKPSEIFEGKEKIKYVFSNNECTTGLSKLPEYGIFLAPNVISEDGSANTTWKHAQIILNHLEGSKEKSFDALLSITAIAGDYIRFSNQGGANKSTQKLTSDEFALSIIALTTPFKPALQYRIDKENGKQPEMYNSCIIPDLPSEKMIGFVSFFKRMMLQKSNDNLFWGDVLPPGGEGKQKRTKYSPKRPLIHHGNFPNPPRSSALGSVALLGAIGEFAKEAEFSVKANEVLESLKDVPIYMIKYGGATSFTYNNHIIELAKEGNLRKIIDSIYYSKLYNQERRKSSNTEYQKFDLFSSRFLQFFNKPTFQDFIAFRAEYPNETKLLFNTYFMKVENINPEIVTSARQLGKWLNLVAYFAAKREIKKDSPNYREKVRDQKAKVLIELESSSFSAKTGDALIAQVVTRAGRLSGMDAPVEADLFMEKAMSGELDLDKAKNLIIAFSRLKNIKENENNNSESVKEETEKVFEGE